MCIVFNKAWIEFALFQKTGASFLSSRIMAHKLFFCFLCLILRLVETQVLCAKLRTSGMCAKLRTAAASNNSDHARNLSYYCLLAPRIYIVILRAHPVRGESHNQRNATGEVATLSMTNVKGPLLKKEPVVKSVFLISASNW